MGSQVRSSGSAVIDEYAIARIDHWANQQAKWLDLPDDTREDIRHDMVVELLQALERFDPSKAKRETFINRVLRCFVRNALRTAYARKRRSCDSPIHLDDIKHGFEPSVNDPRTGELDEHDLCDLRSDGDRIVARMPDRVARVARALMRSGPTEAAEELEIARTSIYRNIKEIRAFFVEAGIET